MQSNSEKLSERFSMIGRWKASGKSIASFCKEENISYFTFWYWRDKYMKQSGSSGFIKLKRSSSVAKRESLCEIIFTNGNRINISIPSDASYLKELLN